MRRLTAADVTELIAAHNLGLIPQQQPTTDTEPSDWQSIYQMHKQTYGRR